ncbi:uncharacterized protein TNCV_3849621 [Trichonephila clavipes]|nr:uncharacterized protein TNCV_3849621 [Trichonephila clavipes]
MVMSETHSEKRKFGKAGESSVNKKARREVSKKYGKFTEDCIPDGVFPIGDDVFVFASTYYDSVSVHIRRFKKYGKTYYPTPEGITLYPRWIEYIMRKKKVPESLEELPSGLFPSEQHIQITNAYTLHKPVRHKFQRNRVFVSDIDRQFQADLVDMQSLAEFNKGYKYLLTCIDLFSKFAWAVPLKDKFGKSVKSGLEIIFKERKPKVLQTDATGDGNISSTVKQTIDVGCYETMLDIISAVQLALPKNPNRFTIIYNKAAKRVKINAVQGSSLHLENLGELLGFKRNAIIIGNMKSEFVADAWSNFSVFYVYSDLISPQIVGDTQAPLLRIVRTKGENFKEAVKTRSKESGKKLAQKAIDRVQSMVGKGQYKKKANTYPYRSYIETLLNHGYDSKTSQLTAELFYKDSDDGLKKRTEFFKESATVDMIGCIHSDLFHQDRLLLNFVDLKIKLIRSKPEFCLQGSEGFKVVLDHVSLFIRKVRVNPGVILGHAKALEKTSAKYPINRVLCKVYSIPKGSMSFIQDNIFSGQMPKKLFVGYVDNEAFHGAFSKSPYEFKHFNLNFIECMWMDNQCLTIH